MPGVQSGLDSKLQRLTFVPIVASNANGTGPVQAMRASPAPTGGFRASQGPMTPNGNPSAMDRKTPAPEAPRPEHQYVDHQGSTQQTVSSTNPKLAAQQAADNKNIVRRKLTGYVGFANLPNQWHRKSVRKGFNFNVMVVGEFFRTTRLPTISKPVDATHF